MKPNGKAQAAPAEELPSGAAAANGKGEKRPPAGGLKDVPLTPAQRIESRADALGKEWAQLDRQTKEWLVHAGMIVQQDLNDRMRDMGLSLKDALEELRAKLLFHTGEDKSKDLPRCMQVYFASRGLGKPDQFAKLPIRAQKAFGACFSLDDEGPGRGFTYKLKEDFAGMVRDVFAFALGLKTQTAVAPEVRQQAVRNNGVLIGETIDLMLGAAKEGKNPLQGEVKEAPQRPPAPAPQPPISVPAPAPAPPPVPVSSEAPAGKPEPEPEEDDSEPVRPPATIQAAPMSLSQEPTAAAGELGRQLLNHSEPARVLHELGAHARELSVSMVESLIIGWVDGGRYDDVVALAAVVAREVRVARYLKKNPSATVAEARKATSESAAKVA